MSENSEKMLFLITGTQRSGTTLLSRVLSAHPEVFVQNETYLPRLFATAKASGQSLQDGLCSFLQERAGIDGDGSSHAFFGLKDPLLAEHQEQLDELCSVCKTVVLVRDPRSVVLSYMQNRWGLGTNVYTGAQRWLRQNKTLLALNQRYPSQMLLLRYEDLVGDNENSVRGVLDFLGIPYHSQMSEYHKQDAYYPIEKENENADRAPDPRLIEQWRSMLSPRQRGIVQGVCGSMMVQMGYVAEDPDVLPNLFQRMYYRFHQRIVGELQLQLRLREKRSAKKARVKRRAASVNH